MKKALPAILHFFDNFKHMPKYGWNWKHAPTAWAIAVSTAGSSAHTAETHRHKLNTGNRALEANTNLQSQVRLLIRLWERQTVINTSRVQLTHQPRWYSRVGQSKGMSRQSSWVGWSSESAVSEPVHKEAPLTPPTWDSISVNHLSSHCACSLTLAVLCNYQGLRKSHSHRCDA